MDDRLPVNQLRFGQTDGLWLSCHNCLTLSLIYPVFTGARQPMSLTSLSSYSIQGRGPRGEAKKDEGIMRRGAPQQHQLKVATMQVCTAPAIECINAGAPPSLLHAMPRSRYSLAIVENGDANLDGEAGRPVETVPGCVGWRAGVRLERDVRTHRRRGRTWLWGGPG